jgi:hypothetical protein
MLGTDAIVKLFLTADYIFALNEGAVHRHRLQDWAEISCAQRSDQSRFLDFCQYLKSDSEA